MNAELRSIFMAPAGFPLLCVVLLFLGVAGASRGADDSPVMSPAEDGPAPGIREGVVGHVLDAGGLPVADAFIQPRPLDPGAPPIPEIAVVSDTDGRYEWRLFPGSYEITASAPGYREMTLRAVVEAGRAVVVDFTLERAP